MLRRVGAYVLGDAFAAGGMATVHLGSLAAPGNFARTVAVKRLRPELLAENADLAALLTQEAQVASKLRHVNLAAVADVALHEGELLLVSEYVNGVSLAELRALSSTPIPLGVASALASGLLRALAYAHRLDSGGASLEIVHRDVCPSNLLVGADGVPRLIDFGIALVTERARFTRTGEVRGKVGYLSPEHLAGDAVDARADVYSAAVVIWEMLAGKPLFDAKPGRDLLEQIAIGVVDRVRRFRPEVPAEIDDGLRAALSPSKDRRPASALDLARAIEAALPPASPSEVAAWVADVAGERLAEREVRLAAFEVSVAELRSVSGGPAPRRAQRAATLVRRSVLLVGAATALGVTLAIAGVRSVDHWRAAEARPALATSAGATADPDLPTHADPTAIPAPKWSTAPPPVADPVSTSAAPAPSDGVPRESDVQAMRHRGPSLPRPAHARSSHPACETTYDRDANGHKVYKNSCF